MKKILTRQRGVNIGYKQGLSIDLLLLKKRVSRSISWLCRNIILLSGFWGWGLFRGRGNVLPWFHRGRQGLTFNRT